MKKLWETLLFAAVFASLLMTFAFADLVQPGPVEVLTSFGLPLLIIAAAVIALALAGCGDNPAPPAIDCTGAAPPDTSLSLAGAREAMRAAAIDPRLATRVAHAQGQIVFAVSAILGALAIAWCITIARRATRTP